MHFNLKKDAFAECPVGSNISKFEVGDTSGRIGVGGERCEMGNWISK